MPWVGRHVGTPCLLMWALASTSPALVELAGCRVLLHICPWQVDWEQELRGLEEILIVNPPRDGAGRDGDWGSIRCIVPIHPPPRGLCPGQWSSMPQIQGCSGGRQRVTVLPRRACLSLTTLRGRECGVLTLRDPQPWKTAE